MLLEILDEEKNCLNFANSRTEETELNIISVFFSSFQDDKLQKSEDYERESIVNAFSDKFERRIQSAIWP